MALSAVHWQRNARLINASENKPSLKPGDPNTIAVQVFQRVLMSLQFLPLAFTSANTPNAKPKGSDDGLYQQRTSAAVREAETEFGLTLDQGIAGKEVFTALDKFLLDPAQFGAGRLAGRALALTDVPLARTKIVAAINAIEAMERALFGPTPAPLALDPITVDAMRVHFKLSPGAPTIGVARQMTQADLTEIRDRFAATRGVLDGASARFVDFMPENGPGTAAEALFGGVVRFGPVYRNFDRRGLPLIGKESRAAVLIHECTHVIDAISGQDGTIHISEFQERYRVQPADFAKHNPSSYATFAAHIVNKGDPSPRPGLGPGARSLGGA
jgi:peptidoglycan hydrolase-like protein with peptidoglycan-binding domain